MMRVPVVTLVAVGIAVGCFAWFNHAEEKKNTDVQAFSLVAELVTEDTKKAMKINKTFVETETKVKRIEEDENLVYVSPYDFEELNEINDEIVAWVNIPETSVDYPIVFNGTDDYIHKDLQGEYSYAGTPFVDKTAAEPMRDSVNVIYGHHMKDGSMFAAIDQYNDPIFFQEHNVINVYLNDKEMTLTPVMTITGKADAAVREIITVDSLNEFAKGKTITAGDLPEDFEYLYIFVTCNYSDKDFRTYLVCSK